MQKILNKRVFRSLKKHWFRYAALFLLIAMTMSIIIAMVGSGDAIIEATKTNQENAKLEDGYFQTFVKLSDETLDYLSDKGVTIENQSYIDFAVSDGSIIRIFKARENIDLALIENGRAVSGNGEIMLEKVYASTKKINVGDVFSIAENEFTVVGTGCVPNDESPKKKTTDTSPEYNSFSYAIVSADDYNALLETGKAENSEVYSYSYLLNDKMTDNELETYLRSLELDRESVTDEFFLEMLESAEQTKTDITNGINELVDGTSELSDGAYELADNNADLINGANTLFEETLRATEEQLNSSGFTVTLTEENFVQELDRTAEMAEQISPAAALSINAAKESLVGLKNYRDSIIEYTDGVAELADGSTELKDGVDELKEQTDDTIDEYFSYDLDNLTLFVPTEDNSAVGAAADDVKTQLAISYLAGVIVMILIAYVISVFVIHSIDRETSVIGAFYALGVKRNQLILHYLMLPVIVTFIGGLAGTIMGFSPVMLEQQLSTNYEYFSIPTVDYVYPIYLIIYGVVIPPVIAAIVNFIVIRKKLSVPALSMLRNEQKQNKASNMKLKSKSFVGLFRIRQTLREMRSCFAVVIGMFISLLVLMLGLNCYIGCNNISVNNKADTAFEYMYIYKYTVDEVPEGGEAAYTESFQKRFSEYDFEITLCGIDNDNKYFDFDVPTGENLIALSSSAAIKYNVSEGDIFVVTDEVNDRNYAFTVDRIVDYSVGLFAFMDIGSMRSLFGQEDNYFNTVFSDKDLDIETGRLYGVTTKEGISKASDVNLTLMAPTYVTLIGMSVVVFVLVMYLMVKVMIDRSAQSIALMKVFGYRKKEIRKLYLDGNFIIVAISGLIFVPLSKFIMDLMFPSFVSNLPVGYDLTTPWYLLAGIYVGVILCYLFISTVLTRRLNRISPAEILKNRE